jgi:hypothetical protein
LTGAVISVLTFGLVCYYVREQRCRSSIKIEDGDEKEREKENKLEKKIERPSRDQKDRLGDANILSSVIFAAVYAAFLVVSVVLTSLNYDSNDEGIFIEWQQFTAVDIIKLSSAIALSFFFPGYALISIILTSKQSLGILPKILLGYILSMFIAGFTGYIMSLTGFEVADIRLAIVTLYLAILIGFMQKRFNIFREKKSSVINSGNHQFRSYLNFQVNKIKILKSLPSLIVLGSLLTLMIFSTSILHGGVIIGDQWYHHGRALQFVSGDYDIIDASNSDFVYPPLLPAVLSSFFIIADVPSVNAYGSIGFLNIMAVFAFYYFCKKWMPVRGRKSALLAAVLFMLGSGFGWIHAVSVFVSDPSDLSQTSSMQTILTSSKQTYDIRTPSTFLLASHPDFSTGLQLIVLPGGFVLLGMLKEETKNRKDRYKYILVLLAAVVLGIFSHDEIYFFVIIASLLPPIFKLPNQNFMYFVLLSAIGVALFANYIFSEEYLGYTVIIGIPLIVICFFFVVITWVLYLTRLLERIFEYIKHRSVFGNVSPFVYKRARLIIGIVSVLIVSYLYAFTFITWSELSLRDIEIQTSESFPRNVPWYLYPMKLGLVGFLGISYLLLCIFKKFEKEVLVFGIIAVIAIFTGPYYDEHRFSKYAMGALAGLASILIYEIILYLNNTKIYLRYLFNGLLMTAIIVLSSVSTLIFISYDAWSLEQETDDIETIWLNRRNFPTSSELDMFEFLRNYNEPLVNNTSNSSIRGIQNIATWPDEYQTRLGLLGKFQGFTGVPIPLMLQSPLVLNGSSLESFYSLLSSSGTGLIVVPSKDIVNGSEVTGSDAGEKYKTYQTGTEVDASEKSADKSSDVAKFAMRNFKKVYQDNNYTILGVPRYLNSPSSTGDIAIMHPSTQENLLLQPADSTDENHNNTNNNKITLPYESQVFDKISNSDYVEIAKNKKGITLNSFNKSQTLWSSKIEYGNDGPNYIGSEFKVINQNEDRPHDECGVVWESEDKKYYVRIRDDKLEFSETPAPEDRYVIENHQVELDDWIPYTLKVSFLGDYLKVYVNDILRLKVPSSLYDDSNPISRVGIRCAGNTAEFGPIEISRISDQESHNNSYNNSGLSKKEQTYQYYYPLTSLALSDANYDTFLPGDNSIFSKGNVLLTTNDLGSKTDDEIDNKEQIDRFLKYVWDGGTLTVINTDKEAEGWLATSFLSIKYDNHTSDFDSIVKPPEAKYSLKVSGNVSAINSIATDVRVKAYYEKNNVMVSPFSMEKNHGKGKIVFVEASGYFDAVSQSPELYFSTLADIPRLFGISTDNLNSNATAKNTISSNYYNLGNISVLGDTTIDSSSILLPMNERAENDSNKRFLVQDLYIINHSEKDHNSKSSVIDVNNSSANSISSRDIGNKSVYYDVWIKTLEFYGSYKATIKTSERVSFPHSSYPLSQVDYFGVSIPTGFDLKVQLLDKDAYVNITTVDGTQRTVASANQSDNKTNESEVTEIYFHNIRLVPPLNSLDFLIKKPDLNTLGNVTFESLFQGQYDFDVSKGIEGNPLELTGANMNMSLGYVDDYDKSSKNRHTTDYLTYIKTLQFNQPAGSSDTVELKIPGDISDEAKEKGIVVPWKKAMVSNANMVLLSVLAGGLLLGIYLLWHKQRGRAKVGKHV